MDKFCDFITNPDWWSVVATIIAAIVAACITSKFSKRQTELQEQQLKIQEHQNELQEQQIKLQEQQNKQQEYNLYYWCPLKVRSVVPMCPQYYQTNIVDTFSKSKPLNQKA